MIKWTQRHRFFFSPVLFFLIFLFPMYSQAQAPEGVYDKNSFPPVHEDGLSVLRIKDVISRIKDETQSLMQGNANLVNQNNALQKKIEILADEQNILNQQLNAIKVRFKNREASLPALVAAAKAPLEAKVEELGRKLKEEDELVQLSDEQSGFVKRRDMLNSKINALRMQLVALKKEDRRNQDSASARLVTEKSTLEEHIISLDNEISQKDQALEVMAERVSLLQKQKEEATLEISAMRMKELSLRQSFENLSQRNKAEIIKIKEYYENKISRSKQNDIMLKSEIDNTRQSFNAGDK